jgi:hypothetical protein
MSVGRDRSFGDVGSMSGFTPKAADQASLFDHLVGERNQLIRHMEAKHFGDLAVDHELEVYLASG